MSRRMQSLQVPPLRLRFGGFGDGVAAGAQVCGHGVEGGEVEAGQAGYWAT